MIYIKVLHIISGNDNGGGGAHVLNICACPKEDFENQICCIGKGTLYKKANLKGIKTVAYRVKDIITGEFIKYINKNHIDILNFHGPKSNFMYFLIKRRINIPCAVTVHSDYRYDFLNNKIKYLLFTPLSKIALKKFKFYICVSNYIKILLENKNFRGEKCVVNNGINIQDIKCVSKQRQIRSNYKIVDNDFVFIMVARMHPIKNHVSLIKAFFKLSKEFKNTKLMLVGDGELEYKLKEYVRELGIEKRVIFTGFKSNSIDYVNSSDISILTSFNEGGAPPLVILESAVVRKAVIVSKVGDMKEFINDENGFLINPNSVEDIYSKMKLAYINRDKLDTMGQVLYENVKENFSMEKFWEKYYSFYKKQMLK